jgi:hypothetical protein
MKKFVLLTLGLLSATLLFSVNSVYAPWATLGTGYAITSDFHGVDVPIGTEVTVTAGTLDTRVTQVTFRWHRPDESVAREVTVPVFTNGDTGQWNNGTSALVRYAVDSYSPDVLGDWGVQAFFQGSGGSTKAGIEDVIKIRATSFNVIPEVPVGTIAILLSMFGAFGVFAVKKRKATSA